MTLKPIPEIKELIADAVLGNKHNVIVLWGELGLGKTTFALKLLLWSVLTFYYGFEKTGPAWNDDNSGCETRHETFCEHWQTVLKYLDFTFYEVRDRLKNAVLNRRRISMMLWDDLGVYFHRSNIMYMHPDVKDFFSKYNFIRPYLANLVITVPDINFVPEQLLAFCTGDVWITRRGFGDFDRSRLQRSFWGRKRSWTKHYDGFKVEWIKCPEVVYRRYDEIRHQHAVAAFAKPEEIFVTAMPKREEFKEEDSIF